MLIKTIFAIILVITFNNAFAETIGERIASQAEKFIGTPYDQDPIGKYVTDKKIIDDDKVDCMYLVYRCTELALAKNQQQAITIALDKRFIHEGIIQDNVVINYDDRFQYGEDMIASGKFGHEIIGSPFSTVALLKNINKPHNGDLIFFINSTEKRVKTGAEIGHLGIIEVTQNKIFLIHAHGHKDKRGGSVVKVLLRDYVKQYPFNGARITRI